MTEYFTKADAEEFKEELKRYLGILAEDFQQKLNFVIDAQEDIKRLIRSTNEETKKELRNEFKIALKDTEDRLRQEFRGALKETMDELKDLKEEIISHRDSTEIRQVKRKKKS